MRPTTIACAISPIASCCTWARSARDGEPRWSAISGPFRQVSLEVMTPGGIQAMVVRRLWRWWMARIEVQAWDGRILGVIQQRWRWFRRQFDVVGPGGEVWATIVGGVWRPWTYPVSSGGVEVAVIRKRWSGLARE